MKFSYFVLSQKVINNTTNTNTYTQLHKCLTILSLLFFHNKIHICKFVYKDDIKAFEYYYFYFNIFVLKMIAHKPNKLVIYGMEFYL